MAPPREQRPSPLPYLVPLVLQWDYSASLPSLLPRLETIGGGATAFAWSIIGYEFMQMIATPAWVHALARTHARGDPLALHACAVATVLLLANVAYFVDDLPVVVGGRILAGLAAGAFGSCYDSIRIASGGNSTVVHGSMSRVRIARVVPWVLAPALGSVISWISGGSAAYATTPTFVLAMALLFIAYRRTRLPAKDTRSAPLLDSDRALPDSQPHQRASAVDRDQAMCTAAVVAVSTMAATAFLSACAVYLPAAARSQLGWSPVTLNLYFMFIGCCGVVGVVACKLLRKAMPTSNLKPAPTPDGAIPGATTSQERQFKFGGALGEHVQLVASYLVLALTGVALWLAASSVTPAAMWTAAFCMSAGYNMHSLSISAVAASVPPTLLSVFGISTVAAIPVFRGIGKTAGPLLSLMLASIAGGDVDGTASPRVFATGITLLCAVAGLAYVCATVLARGRPTADPKPDRRCSLGRSAMAYMGHVHGAATAACLVTCVVVLLLSCAPFMKPGGVLQPDFYSLAWTAGVWGAAAFFACGVGPAIMLWSLVGWHRLRPVLPWLGVLSVSLLVAPVVLALHGIDVWWFRAQYLLYFTSLVMPSVLCCFTPIPPVLGSRRKLACLLLASQTTTILSYFVFNNFLLPAFGIGIPLVPSLVADTSLEVTVLRTVVTPLFIKLGFSLLRRVAAMSGAAPGDSVVFWVFLHTSNALYLRLVAFKLTYDELFLSTIGDTIWQAITTYINCRWTPTRKAANAGRAAWRVVTRASHHEHSADEVAAQATKRQRVIHISDMYFHTNTIFKMLGIVSSVALYTLLYRDRDVFDMGYGGGVDAKEVSVSDLGFVLGVPLVGDFLGDMLAVCIKLRFRTQFLEVWSSHWRRLGTLCAGAMLFYIPVVLGGFTQFPMIGACSANNVCTCRPIQPRLAKYCVNYTGAQ